MRRKLIVCTILTLAIVGIGYTAFANVKLVDPAVLSAFNKLFPEAQKVRWDEDGKAFMAFFENNKVASYCRLDASGNWMEKGVVHTKALPVIVEDAIVKLYEDAEEVEKYRVALPNDQKGYLVIIDNVSEYMELLVNDEGKVLRERSLPDEDDGEE